MELAVAVAFFVGMAVGGVLMHGWNLKGKQLVAREREDILKLATYWKDRAVKAEQHLKKKLS